MQFNQRLRESVRNGDVTASVRIWKTPRVKVGNFYPMEEGFIVIESIREIELGDITPELAIESGFLGVIDLLKVAKHGVGERVFLVTFRYAATKTPVEE